MSTFSGVDASLREMRVTEDISSECEDPLEVLEYEGVPLHEEVGCGIYMITEIDRGLVCWDKKG